MENNLDYRAYVGPVNDFDRFTYLQFNLLTSLGLRDTHTLLDIGCGSLRAGRLFIPYLRAGNYFGIEPVPELINQGLENELGKDIVEIKRPQFDHNDQFQLDKFGCEFDYLLAQSIFSHISKKNMETCIKQAAKVMKPDSIFVATYFKGDTDYKGDDWIVKSTFTEETIDQLITENGLQYFEIDWPHPDLQTWLLIQKKAAEKPQLCIVDTQAEQARVREQLQYCMEKLARLENNLYVRVGLAIRNFLRAFIYGMQRFRIRSATKQAK